MTIEDMQISRNGKKLYAITKNPPKMMIFDMGEICTLIEEIPLTTV
jgi:hypothetical protein